MRKGSTRLLNLTKVCECGATFQCSDPKRKRCPKCSVCPHCQTPIRIGYTTCIKCKRFNKTAKQKAQWDCLHKSICGDNNPSKRPDVRKKLSEGKMGDLNPARIHRALFAAHIAKYRPGKVSKLEDLVAIYLPSYARQYKIGWYSIDFADPICKIAVEVQGCWHHSCPVCFPKSPEHKTQRITRGNDLRRAKYLLSHGWRLVNLWEHDIRNNTPVRNDVDKDLHTEHCCVLHGCAFGEDGWGCTVTTYKKPQSHLCGKCQDSGIYPVSIVQLMCPHDKYFL